MFGQDEHTKAMMAHWQKSKVLRDPAALTKLAESKGLKLSAPAGLGAAHYRVFAGGRALAGGTLEQVGAFLDTYTAVSAIAATGKKIL